MNRSQVRWLWREIGLYHQGKLWYFSANQNELSKEKEASLIGKSTAASIFWTLDQMDRIIANLASVGTCSCLASHSILMTKGQKILQIVDS